MCSSDLVEVVSGPATEVWVGATRSGLFVAQSRASAPTAYPVDVQPNDRPLTLIHSTTDHELLCFTSEAEVARVRLNELPLSSRAVRGQKPIQMTRGQELAAIVTDEQPFLLLVTERGEVKRCEPESLPGAHATLGAAMALPDGDRLVAVVPHDEGDELLLATAEGKVLRTAAKPIRVVKSASAGGVAGMRIAPGDRIVAACAVRTGDLVVLQDRKSTRLNSSH